MSGSGDDGGGPPREPVVQFPQANIVAMRAIADVLASTLGPTPNDAMVIRRLATRQESNHPGVPATDDFVVSSDGATILDKLPLEHPIAPLIRRVAGPDRPGDTDVVGEDIPDGVATRVVLCAELLDQAEKLLDQGVHPYDIQQGYQAALTVALQTIDEMSRPITELPANGRALVGVARTAMTGNDVAGFREQWATLAVEAVDHVGMPDEKTLAVRTIGAGSIDDSRLVPGAVLDLNNVCHDDMPKRVEDASILVLSGYYSGGGLQDPDVPDNMTARAEDPEDVAAFQDVFSSHRRDVVDNLVEVGVDVLVARQGITPEYQRLLAGRGIMGIRRVDQLDLKQLALATGADQLQDPTDISPENLGRAGLVEEVMREPRRHRRRSRRMVIFDRCAAPDSVCMLLRGVFDQLDEQATTSIRKAVAAVAIAKGCGGYAPGVIPGGGATDLRIAQSVRGAATDRASRAQLAMLAFGDAVERLVSTLAMNAGMDHVATISDLRAAHDRGEAAGVILPEGEVGDAFSAGVLDPADLHRRSYVTAVEVAITILRIDDAIDADFTQEPAGPGESIYDEEAEKHLDYLEQHEDTRWE